MAVQPFAVNGVLIPENDLVVAKSLDAPPRQLSVSSGTTSNLVRTAMWVPGLPFVMGHFDAAGSFSPAQLSNSTPLLGGWVVVVANGIFGQALLSPGIYNGVAQDDCGAYIKYRFLTTVPLNRSLLGGGLFDLTGALQGFVLPCEDGPAAIPIPEVKRAIASVNSDSGSLLAKYGIRVATASDGQTTLVTEVWDSWSAADAGFEPGDQLQSIDGQKVTSSQDAVAAMLSDTSTEHEVEVRRGSRSLTLNLIQTTIEDAAMQPALTTAPTAGVSVTEITMGSSAAKAGIKSGDRVLLVNGHPATDAIVQRTRPVSRRGSRLCHCSTAGAPFTGGGATMNQLSSIALILLLSLLAGHLVKLLRIPEVTGYILAGIIVGPSALGWINEQNLTSLSVFSEIALALILFSIGSIFEFRLFREIGRAVVRVTVCESLCVWVLVVISTLAAGQRWQIALLLGVLAMETGAASTLMVLREYNASGPFSRTLTGVIAINNLICLGSFLLLTAVLQLTGSLGTSKTSAYETLYLILWQLLGSAALGYLVGLLLSAWATRVVEHGETLILLIGCLLLCAGLSIVLNLSTLVVSITLGATVANLSANTGRLAQVQSRTDPPFYAVFFVIAGAHLQLGLLKSLGVVGIAYILARAIGKLTGSYFGTRLARLPAEYHSRMGFALLAHAGLAIGLVLSLAHRHPELGSELSTIVLGAILVYEILGPVSVRNVLLRSGESQARTEAQLEVL